MKTFKNREKQESWRGITPFEEIKSRRNHVADGLITYTEQIEE